MTKLPLAGILLVVLLMALPSLGTATSGKLGQGEAPSAVKIDANIRCRIAQTNLESARMNFVLHLAPNQVSGVNKAFQQFASNLEAQCKTFAPAQSSALDSCQDDTFTDPVVIVRLCEFTCSWLSTGTYSIDVAAQVAPTPLTNSHVSPSIYGDVSCGMMPAPPYGESCAAAGERDGSFTTSCGNSYAEGVAAMPLGGAVFAACCGTGDFFFVQTDYSHP